MITIVTTYNTYKDDEIKYDQNDDNYVTYDNDYYEICNTKCNLLEEDSSNIGLILMIVIVLILLIIGSIYIYTKYNKKIKNKII